VASDIETTGAYGTANIRLDRSHGPAEPTGGMTPRQGEDCDQPISAAAVKRLSCRPTV